MKAFFAKIWAWVLANKVLAGVIGAAAALTVAAAVAVPLSVNAAKNKKAQEETHQNEPSQSGDEGQGGEQQKQPSISLDKTALSVKVGATEQLIARANDGTGDVVWSSSNPAKATVDQTGHVTGVEVGSAVITATYSG